MAARTHPCFKPFVMLKGSEVAPSITILPDIPSWNCLIMEMNFFGQPNFFNRRQSPSRFTVSKAFVRSMKAAYKGRFCSRHFFLKLTGDENHIRRATTSPETTLRLRQDFIGYVLEETREEHSSQYLSGYRQQRDSTIAVAGRFRTLPFVDGDDVWVLQVLRKSFVRPDESKACD